MAKWWQIFPGYEYTGFGNLCETNCKGSSAQTVNARENVLMSKDGHDIQEYEAKGIKKNEAVVFEQFQFPRTPLKISTRPIFERKML